MTTTQAFATVAIIAVATLLTRVLPFLVFPAHRKTPAVISYLGKTLPYAVTGMLVVYCLKDTSLIEPPYGLAEMLGIVAVTGLYLWRHNTLLAIAGGTALYMVLLQLVF